MNEANTMADITGDAVQPTPEQIDALALELHTMGVRVPACDTAFFQAAVRKWLASWKVAEHHENGDGVG